MMESSNNSNGSNEMDQKLQIIRHPSYSLPWFDIRVFYVRISGFPVDDSTPEHLSLNHIPLVPDAVLEVNGARCPMDSQQIFTSSVLKRDRVDKKLEEATFITTDSIRITGSVKFQVFDKEDLVISGFLEMLSANGFITESRNNAHKKWAMKCETVDTAGVGFLRGKQISRFECSGSPTIEVYVAGCFSGTPVVLTKRLQINPYKKHRKVTGTGTLHSVPEYDVAESREGTALRHDLQVAEYKNYMVECDEDYNDLYWRQIQYMEDEDGDLSWFNAGVRVGVGVSLGFCLGMGIGLGLLVRSYHTASRTIRRRFL